MYRKCMEVPRKKGVGAVGRDSVTVATLRVSKSNQPSERSRVRKVSKA